MVSHIASGELHPSFRTAASSLSRSEVQPCSVDGIMEHLGRTHEFWRQMGEAARAQGRFAAEFEMMQVWVRLVAGPDGIFSWEIMDLMSMSYERERGGPNSPSLGCFPGSMEHRAFLRGFDALQGLQ